MGIWCLQKAVTFARPHWNNNNIISLSIASPNPIHMSFSIYSRKYIHERRELLVVCVLFFLLFSFSLCRAKLSANKIYFLVHGVCNWVCVCVCVALVHTFSHQLQCCFVSHFSFFCYCPTKMCWFEWNYLCRFVTNHIDAHIRFR